MQEFGNETSNDRRAVVRIHPFAKLNATQLKAVAVVSMLVDHTAASVLKTALASGRVTGYDWQNLYSLMRLVGRLAFPIFVFFLVEGFFMTHDRWKYLGRLAVFALISEVPFDLAFRHCLLEWGHQNVGVELVLIFLMLMALDRLRSNKSIQESGAGGKVLLGVGSVTILVIFMVLGYLTRADYKYGGVLMAFGFYWMRGWPLLSPLVGGGLFAFYERNGIWGCLLNLLYNGERGRQWKYFFYIFYPAHLLVLALISSFLI